MIAADLITHWENSLIQHGKGSDRVYLMKLDPADCPAIIGGLHELALEKGYSKIFAKVPGGAAADFLRSGYETEAQVPGLYNGQEDGFFLSYYINPERTYECLSQEFSHVLALAQKKASASLLPSLPEQFCIRVLTPEDTPAMAALYSEVFDSYPFPIFSPAYLVETMEQESVYLGVFCGEELAALASCEMDTASHNAEMTDFATREAYRSSSLAAYLLQAMDEEMQKRDIKTTFTIARAGSYGMNITFGRSGYTFAGRLRNNTDIGGSIESMNVWYKCL